MNLVNNSPWSLLTLDRCSTDLTHYFPSGPSEYTLTYQLIHVQINPQDQENNYTAPFPSNLYVQVILENYFLKSNVYDLVT